MSKRRVQSASRKASGSDLEKLKIKDCHRYIGISVSGGKSDKSCVAILEYYPVQKKIFLSKLIEKIKAEEFISADLKIHEIITQYKDQTESLAFDVPLSLPKCVSCQLNCPGYEACDEVEIKYLRSLYQQEVDKKKPKKLYTPYTQRCADAYLSHLEPDLDAQHALGANLAPLTVRAMFIARRLKLPSLEVSTRVALWKLGQELKVNKTHLKVFRNSIGGEDAREVILQHFSDKWNVFFYRQDLRSMIENHHAFEAFLCAYVGFLHAAGKTLSTPKDFPKHEMWITIPA